MTTFLIILSFIVGIAVGVFVGTLSNGVVFHFGKNKYKNVAGNAITETRPVPPHKKWQPFKKKKRR